MGKYKLAYRCGLFFREAREMAGISREELGAQMFPFSTAKSRYNILCQIETDRRGVTIDQAHTLDTLAKSCLVDMIEAGEVEFFNRLTSGNTKNK
jgi:ribosome-binding protein aMBF1 (putative translation factor)